MTKRPHRKKTPEVEDEIETIGRVSTSLTVYKTPFILIYGSIAYGLLTRSVLSRLQFFRGKQSFAWLFDAAQEVDGRG